MKLFWLMLSIATVAARPAVDVEKTVLQVQNILKANSQLPRLTRQEILDLLNDIRAEDAKSTSTSSEQASTEKLTTISPLRNEENEISSEGEIPDLKDNIVPDEKDSVLFTSEPTKPTVESTTKAQTTLMVVLPYTPRDGSSLQELYTRPPRTEVVPIPKTTTKPKINKNNNLELTLKNNHDMANKFMQDFPSELQAFLDAHGLKGNSAKDHFLLPLEGFKPLPPAKVVDGTVQLPENILLTYDLISPSVESNTSGSKGNLALNNYLYEPLRPEFPFELHTSETKAEEVILPLDLPKSRKTKSSNSQPQPIFEPIDYDSVKVIPLGQGPSPVQEVVSADSEQSKRQASSTAAPEITTTAAPDTKEETPAADSAPSADTTDTGASISDLEESFGGAAPEIPGDSELPPPRKNGFYWMADWNSFLEVGDGDTKVNIRFEPKLGDPQMFLPVTVP